MIGFVRVGERNYEVVQAELHVPLLDETRHIFLCVNIQPPGGFAFWYVQLPGLGRLEELSGQRIHVRCDGFSYQDDTLATDCTGAESWTDLNYWQIDGRAYSWGEMRIDFQRVDGGRYRILVTARLSENDLRNVDWENASLLQHCPVEASAELSIVADERNPLEAEAEQ